jgi:hypothetical protein
MVFVSAVPARKFVLAKPISWLTDEETWPQDRSFDAFCRWFDWQHHSMLIDLCDELLTDELD